MLSNSHSVGGSELQGDAYRAPQKRLLIVSFSRVARDPRVMRQVRLFSKQGFSVTTLGHGSRPSGTHNHVELPAAIDAGLAKKAAVAVRMYTRRRAGRYAVWPEVQRIRAWKDATNPRFDVVLGNDLLALPVALGFGVPVHADLHEYSLDQGVGWQWRLKMLPLLRWAAGFLGRASSVSTVAPGIAERYAREFGVDPFVVTNSPSYFPGLEVLGVGRPIRLTYMGAASRLRSLEMSVKAVIAANLVDPGSVILDCYLVAGDEAYIEELSRLAGDVSVTGVRVLPPVEFDRIVPTLRSYDVSLMFYPPTNTNVRHSLPNKFFEAVQARVGVLIGPSPEMVPYVEEFGFGGIVPGWSQEALDRAVAGLSVGEVLGWKMAAGRAAEVLGAEQQDQKWLDAINALTTNPQKP